MVERLFYITIHKSFFVVPTAPPLNVTGYNVSETSIQISWNEILETERNGIINKYTIKYRNIRTSLIGQIEVPAVLTAQVTGLKIILF